MNDNEDGDGDGYKPVEHHHHHYWWPSNSAIESIGMTIAICVFIYGWHGGFR